MQRLPVAPADLVPGPTSRPLLPGTEVGRGLVGQPLDHPAGEPLDHLAVDPTTTRGTRLTVPASAAPTSSHRP